MAFVNGKKVSPVRLAKEFSYRAAQRLRQATLSLKEAECRASDLRAENTKKWAEIKDFDWSRPYPEAEKTRCAYKVALGIYWQRKHEVEALQKMAQQASAKVAEYQRIVAHQLDEESATRTTIDEAADAVMADVQGTARMVVSVGSGGTARVLTPCSAAGTCCHTGRVGNLYSNALASTANRRWSFGCF